jgi:YebC/PmpR family DNA-binding regulatory protein
MGRAFEVRKAAMQKTSAAKTKVYSRFGKEIYMAAKSGEPDPDMNQSLRRIIAQAKIAQVPSDIINRAIDKAKGNDDASYTEVRYEGYGAGGSNLIVECLSDNVNRTYSEVRNCFNKCNGNLGVLNSVVFLYDHVGSLLFPGEDEEAVLEACIEAEVEVKDIESEEGNISLLVEPTDLYKAKEAVEALLGEVEFSTLETTYLPQIEVTLNEEDQQSFDKLLAMLDEIDDVQNVLHNVTL